MTTEIELLPLPEGYDKYSPPRLYDGQMFHEGQMRAYVRANVLHHTAVLQAEIKALRAERDALLDALRQITEWPDGGNRYGQENIKRFARNVIMSNVNQHLTPDDLDRIPFPLKTARNAGDLDFDEEDSRPATRGPGV